MTEWMAFGIVAVICGILAVLVRWAGTDDDAPPEGPDENSDPRGPVGT